MTIPGAASKKEKRNDLSNKPALNQKRNSVLLSLSNDVNNYTQKCVTVEKAAVLYLKMVSFTVYDSISLTSPVVIPAMHEMDFR